MLYNLFRRAGPTGDCCLLWAVIAECLRPHMKSRAEGVLDVLGTEAGFSCSSHRKRVHWSWDACQHCQIQSIQK